MAGVLSIVDIELKVVIRCVGAVVGVAKPTCVDVVLRECVVHQQRRCVPQSIREFQRSVYGRCCERVSKLSRTVINVSRFQERLQDVGGSPFANRLLVINVDGFVGIEDGDIEIANADRVRPVVHFKVE